MSGDEYFDIYQIDSRDEWINGGYDEQGEQTLCDRCGGEMRWDALRHIWICRDCGQEMERADWFNFIGAEPPGAECITSCGENYPFCKKTCDRFTIDPDDPIV